mmetsp:Transcript_1059/g.2522  ORF Transcript_1059/g.2522 Transcript_1059/m.2522 type:complete len:213 (-) Transcript_1059:247-885(-)
MFGFTSSRVFARHLVPLLTDLFFVLVLAVEHLQYARGQGADDNQDAPHNGLHAKGLPQEDDAEHCAPQRDRAIDERRERGVHNLEGEQLQDGGQARAEGAACQNVEPSVDLQTVEHGHLPCQVVGAVEIADNRQHDGGDQVLRGREGELEIAALQGSRPVPFGDDAGGAPDVDAEEGGAHQGQGFARDASDDGLVRHLRCGDHPEDVPQLLY